MKISDMISMCLGNLFRRKMRTLLTIIGVVVGTCAIVVMVSLGLGMNLSQEAMLAEMGDLTIINVMNYGRNENGEKVVLDDAAVAQIQSMDGVIIATPVYNPSYFQPTLYSGKKDRYRMGWATVVGVYSEALPLMGYQLLEGEYPEGPQENRKKPLNVVVGEYTGFDFEDTKSKYNRYTWPEVNEQGELLRQPFVDVMKDEIYLSSKQPDQDEKDNKDDDTVHIQREVQPVARIKEDWNKGYETSRGIIMDINDLKRLEEEYIKANKIVVNKKDDTGYNNVTVKVETMEDVDPVEMQIQAMGYNTRSMETVRKPMQESARKQQLFLGMMGGISLVVAAIGITNTMIMSIYERTREIGVMKVLGCVVGNIRTVFLMEAGVIGFIGGCVGVAISYGVSFAMNYFNFSFSGDSGMGGGYMMGGMGGMMMSGGGSSLPVSVIPLWLVGAAIAFATLVGLVSGILPANRAMKISALEAIKHE